MPVRSPYRDALRLLYVFVAGSRPVPRMDGSGAVAIFEGEARLHAFDFWMRNPDYLADELLDLFDQTKKPRYLTIARAIFEAEEPDIRRFPMIRYRFGAYERLDDTLSLLVSRGLIKITGVKSGDRVRETDFLVMPSAMTLAATIETDFPALSWYARRSQLVAEVAGSDGGAALKKRQYAKVEYAETEMGSPIPSITSKVLSRLESLTGTQKG